MFTVVHTRLILVAAIIITFLISFIGLNRNRGKKEMIEMKARLEVPKTVGKDIGLKSFYDSGKTIDLASDEKNTEKFKGDLKDEGKTIILEE